jgi:prepilin-type processing-associated H-X9-DG protein
MPAVDGFLLNTPLLAVQYDDTYHSAETVATTEITKAVNPGATYPGALWLTPVSWNTCKGGPGAALFGEQIAERHNQGNNVVFCDGHAKWLKKSTLGDFNGTGK